MAIVVDRESEYKGERRVRDAIAGYFSDDVIVYNNREVNGREYDLCLLIKDVCIFVIEVKGWLSDKIKVHGIDDIEVEGYDERQHSPKKQAKSYGIQLCNKLKKKYNLSPLVVDLVAYPFITKAEYYETHLSVISEEQFTIFSEDLNDASLLKHKFQMAYDAKRMIPHAELDAELIKRIRQDEEPDYQETSVGFDNAYSVLSVFPVSVTSQDIKEMVSSYFRGVKQFIFVSDKESFSSILDELDSNYKKENIEPGRNLQIGYKNGVGKTSSLSNYRTFNFEIYLLPALKDYVTAKIVIEDGEIDAYKEILSWLSENSSFNLQQYQVEHASPKNNTLVEAGAGTGKTFSMVSRVAFLCNRKKDNVTNLPDELAMVTFTNDAASNMKERLKQMFINYYILTGNASHLQYVDDVERADIMTIHKFALQLLRNASFYTGLGVDFKITSDEYNREKIYDIYLNQYLEMKEEENPNFISEIPVPIYDLKKKIMGLADHLLQKSIDLSEIKPEAMGITVDNTIPFFNELIQNVVFPAEVRYLEVLGSRNAIDLKDCVILLNQILDYGDENIKKLKLRYLFVDEFQDTDDVQIEVFKKLQKTIEGDCHLFVVGDLKQSIYRFRGARLSAFDQLMEAKRFPWEIFHLNVNYRTDYRLLDLYDAIFQRMGEENYLPYVEKNDRLLGEKKLSADDSNLLQCIPFHGKDVDSFYETLFSSLKYQADVLNRMIVEKRDEGKTLSKEERTIAILVRSNWQVENVVQEAKKRRINIEIKSGGDLFQLESTVDLYKLILAVENPQNPLYLVNFIKSNYTDLKLDYQKLHGMSEEEKLHTLQDVLDKFFKVRMGKKWGEVLDEIYTEPVLFAIKHIYDALQPWKIYSKNKSDQTVYMANYNYLLEKIIRFARVDVLTIDQVSKYLEINILTGQKEAARSIEASDEGVHITCITVHKSKGLEYGTVILPYTSEDIGDLKKVKLDANYSDSKLSYMVLFDNKIREHNSNYSEDTEKDEQIAEEARILYVALTRAIRNCVWLLDVDKNAPISWATLLEA